MKSSKKITNMTYAIIGVILSMVLLSFAAVPIYDLFCRSTGFGGKTKVALKSTKKMGRKVLKVKFDSNVAPNLGWRFIPKQREIDLIPGENVLVFYYVENMTDKDIIGTAIYNVTPLKAGSYFNKIYCFCFEEQLVRAKTSVLMPVTFFIDPDIETDFDTKDLDEITLSYSFFKVRELKKKDNPA